MLIPFVSVAVQFLKCAFDLSPLALLSCTLRLFGSADQLCKQRHGLSGKERGRKHCEIFHLSHQLRSFAGCSSPWFRGKWCVCSTMLGFLAIRYFRLYLCPGGSWRTEKTWIWTNVRREKAMREDCLFYFLFSGSCPTPPPPCRCWSASPTGLLFTIRSWIILTSTISLDTFFWRSSTSLIFSFLTGKSRNVVKFGSLTSVFEFFNLLHKKWNLVFFPRPWRLSHALHPLVFSITYAFFTLIYYSAGGTNYYFDT